MMMIAPLLAPDLDKDTRNRLKIRISQEYGVSQRTLQRYCIRYRQEGFEGLMPRERNVTAHKISPELLEEAIRLRREVPGRSINTIIQILQLEGKSEPGVLKRSTLQEALPGKGYSASVMRRYRSQECVAQRWGSIHRNDLWQGYTKTGPQLKAGQSSVDTHLYYLVDDATQCILWGGFSHHLEPELVERVLHMALRRFGVPRRIYLGAGCPYRKRWTKQVCGRMGIHLLRAAPRSSRCEGRAGGPEVLVEQFLVDLAQQPPDTLEELNCRFHAWLETPSENPRQGYDNDRTPLRFLDEGMLRRMFLHCDVRKVDKGGWMSFQGEKYQVGGAYAGQEVRVKYEAEHPEELTIELPGGMSIHIQRDSKATDVS